MSWLSVVTLDRSAQLSSMCCKSLSAHRSVVAFARTYSQRGGSCLLGRPVKEPVGSKALSCFLGFRVVLKACFSSASWAERNCEGEGGGRQG